jgi:hypothetical protein
LLLSGFLTKEEANGKNWYPFFEELVRENRVTTLMPDDFRSLLVASENLPLTWKVSRRKRSGRRSLSRNGCPRIFRRKRIC